MYSSSGLCWLAPQWGKLLRRLFARLPTLHVRAPFPLLEPEDAPQGKSVCESRVFWACALLWARAWLLKSRDIRSAILTGTLSRFWVPAKTRLSFILLDFLVLTGLCQLESSFQVTRKIFVYQSFRGMPSEMPFFFRECLVGTKQYPEWVLRATSRGLTQT